MVNRRERESGGQGPLGEAEAKAVIRSLLTIQLEIKVLRAGSRRTRSAGEAGR